MAYLDYNELAPFVSRHFPNGRDERLVGCARSHDSGYFDIHRFYGISKVLPEQVRIDCQPGLFVIADDRIAKFADEITSRMMAEGRLYLGPTVAKLAHDNWSSPSPSLTIQEATYGAQAGTCFALDYAHPLFDGVGGTLRQYYPTLMTAHRVASNPLAICFGVCGILRVMENGRSYVLRVMRGRKMASLESSYGPSAAGSVDWTTDFKTLWDMTVRTMIQEIAEELALRPPEYRILPLAYAREIFRGEKPQVFCLIECRLTRDELTQRLETISEADLEFSSFDFHPLDQRGYLTADIIASLNHEAKMNYYLLEEFLASEAK